MQSSVTRIRSPVKRDSAERYLRITLVSFAATVILTRLLLQLSGYPQVGNANLHIAHVLWGGLLLFIASLLPLLFANRWVYPTGALLAGVGIGLFIDEVGKFITQNNDYFFPAAAPIIYAFFLLTVLLYLRMRRPGPRSARVELYHALEGFEEVLDHDLNDEERADLDARLEQVIRQAEHPDIARLSNALRQFLESDSLYLTIDSPGLRERCLQRARAYRARWVTSRRLRIVVIGGLVVLGLGALANIAVLILLAFVPSAYLEFQIPLGNGAAPQTIPLSSLELGTFIAVVVRLVLGGLVGALLVVGAILMIFGYEERGLVLGYYGLLLDLTTVSLLSFYFDQFSTIAGAIIQFAVLLGVIYYRRRYLILRLDKGRLSPGSDGKGGEERGLETL